MAASNLRKSLKEKFYNAVQDFRSSNGWSMRQMADAMELPYQAVRRWNKGLCCPRPKRLRLICHKFGWSYDRMFRRPKIAAAKQGQRPVELADLNANYMRLQPTDPLEAWSYASLAGAVVFNSFSMAGIECMAVIDHSFGTRIHFTHPDLRYVVFKICVQRGLGLSIMRLRSDDDAIGELYELTKSRLDLFIKELHNVVHGK